MEDDLEIQNESENSEENTLSANTGQELVAIQDEDDDNQRKIYDEQDIKKISIFERLGNAIKTVQNKLEGVRAEGFEVRTLDDEIGGVEVDYEQIDKQTDIDKDVWDDHKPPEAIETFTTEDYKAFIHKKKKGKGKKGRKMGAMTLSDDEIEESMSSHVARLQQLREDRGHDQGGGMMM